MDFRRKFEVGLAWRTAVLVLCIWILSKAFADADLRAGRVVATLFAIVALASLWEFIRRTNFLVSRFASRTIRNVSPIPAAAVSTFSEKRWIPR